MLLKVGELAKRTGLTVRTLHYYDSIGLLKPSGRSDSGYRLYSQADVARLHGIQALRHLGLPLNDIGSLFDQGSESLPLIISRQIQALDHEMAKAAELRGRLALIQDRLASGHHPEMGEWLSTLGLMTTHGKYFTAAELRKIFINWNETVAEWQPLIADIRQTMTRNASASSPETQTLARRWMELSLRWMDGDFDLLKRWGNMCREEPAAHGNSGIDAELFRFINEAIDLRLEAFHRHLRPEELKRLKSVPEHEWITIGDIAERLIQEGVPVNSGQARELALRWSKLVDRLTGNDPLVREKLLTAIAREPILQSGIAIGSRARDYIRRALQAAAPQ